MFSRDLQAKCDSLSYLPRFSYQTSPILWSEENQLTSDSIAIFTKNQKADRLELYNSAFVASQVDLQRFNQIKGGHSPAISKIMSYIKSISKVTIYYLLTEIKL